MSYIVLVAAGTGGHINSAIALGDFFESKQNEVIYMAGIRPLDYSLFKDKKVIHLASSTIRNKGIFSLVLALWNNLRVFFKTYIEFIQKRPKAILGAGGYVCGPVILAGFFQGIPSYILEQNSLMGLTNRILSFFVKRIFVNFDETKGGRLNRSKFVVTGNPVRKEIVDLLNISHTQSERLKILIIGGSLGAKSINEMISEYVLLKRIESNIEIRHQVGAGKGFCSDTAEGIKYTQLEYVDNIVDEYKWCDLIICRSGASTVSELRYVQKPTVFIPYPFATDNHQFYNALFFSKEVDFPITVTDVDKLQEDNFRLLNLLLMKYKRAKYKNRIYKYESVENKIWMEIKNDI